MRCWRIDLRRSLSRYLDEALAPGAIKRLEDHLLDCGECRTRLARLRTGYRYAQQVPAFKPVRDPWAALEAAIARAEIPATPARFQGRSFRFELRKVFAHKATRAILLAALASPGIYFMARQHPALNAGIVRWTDPTIDRDEFHAVGIADIEHNTEPHVVAEGYVAEVRINDEDGDLSFKLVDDLQQAEPFIVCEIIDPIKLTPPPVGSRVRVYGVSRYDGKIDHHWYEVHPVLSIEMVRRRD